MRLEKVMDNLKESDQIGRHSEQLTRMVPNAYSANTKKKFKKMKNNKPSLDKAHTT